MASKDIHVPDLGDFKDVAVIEVLVQPGQTVEVDTPLITLETEKATMDVPSPEAGLIERLHVAKGSRVSAGSLIATVRLGSGGGQPAASAPAAAGSRAAPNSQVAANAQVAASSQTPANRPAKVPDSAGAQSTVASVPAAPPEPPPPVATAGNTHAGPSVRKFARELGVTLERVRGSGPKGRITVEDVKGFVKSTITRGGGGAGDGERASWPKVAVPDFAQFGAVEVQPLGRVQRISGPRVHASWVNLPHVTQFDEADVTELEATRHRLASRAETAGVKLTLLAFIVRACVKALQKFPQFNASLDESGQNIVYKKYFHIGFAADTPQGLLVPVIREADRKDIYQTARALAELSERARAGKLAATDMQGGSFTVSSLGGIGGTAFTPIINAPEVAILGVSRARTLPVFHEGGFVPRLMLPLSLSYDHRIIDGAAGARFTTEMAALLAKPEGLLEAVP